MTTSEQRKMKSTQMRLFGQLQESDKRCNSQRQNSNLWTQSSRQLCWKLQNL